jgi:hypothetical protein
MKQSPQRLETLRRNAIVESAISSNRIEGVEIEPARVRPVVLGRAALRDRNEEEVHGYRRALDWIHRSAAKIEISEKTILRLHELSRGGEGDAGQYRKRDLDIIETAPNGRSRVRFRAVPAKELEEKEKTGDAPISITKRVKAEKVEVERGHRDQRRNRSLFSDGSPVRDQPLHPPLQARGALLRDARGVLPGMA